ncbi:MAG: hypothetical protein ACRCWN_02775 [Fusobacteriaceae bacterium]
MMKFKIAVIGPKSSGIRVEKIISEKYKSLIAKVYPVEKIQDAYKVMELAEQECQGFVFTGIGVYLRIKEQLSIIKPHVYIPYLSSSITKALWELKQKFPKRKKVTIDTIQEEDLKDILEELSIDDLEFHVTEYNSEKTEEEILKFHMDLHSQFENLVSIAGFSWVYEELEKKGCQCIRLYATNSTIQDKIKELEYELKVKNEKESKISIQLLEIEGKERNENSYRWLEINSTVESLIIPYLKEIKGAIFNSGWNRFTIFSTLGAVSNNENICLLKNILSDLERKNIKVSVGNGIGKSALESEINAKKALEMAKKHEGNCIFQINNGKVNGPILDEKELNYTLYLDERELNKISLSTNISVIHLKKIKSVMSKEKKLDFDSEELAFYLNVTTRSTNRIMKKLIDSGYGKEKENNIYTGSGRPKKKIEISF